MDPIQRRYDLTLTNQQTASASPEAGKGRFKSFMKGVGQVAQVAGKALLPLVPGGQVLGAALSRIGNPEQGFDGLGGGMSPYDMLAIQQQMLQEARVYTLISNIIKIRHDSIMSAIRNIR